MQYAFRECLLHATAALIFEGSAAAQADPCFAIDLALALIEPEDSVVLTASSAKTAELRVEKVAPHSQPSSARAHRVHPLFLLVRTREHVFTSVWGIAGPRTASAARGTTDDVDEANKPAIPSSILGGEDTAASSSRCVASFVASDPSAHVLALVHLWIWTTDGTDSTGCGWTSELLCGRPRISTSQQPEATTLDRLTLAAPRGIAMWGYDHVVVCDSGTGSVLRIPISVPGERRDAGMTVLRLAGCGHRAAPRDGPLQQAAFHDLRGICVHPGDSAVLFVQDGLAVRMINTASGVTSTISGTAGPRSWGKMAAIGASPRALRARFQTSRSGSAVLLASEASIVGGSTPFPMVSMILCCATQRENLSSSYCGVEVESAYESMLSRSRSLLAVASSAWTAVPIDPCLATGRNAAAALVITERSCRAATHARVGVIVNSNGSVRQIEVQTAAMIPWQRSATHRDCGGTTAASRKNLLPTSAVKRGAMSPYVAGGLKRAQDRCAVAAATKQSSVRKAETLDELAVAQIAELDRLGSDSAVSASFSIPRSSRRDGLGEPDVFADAEWAFVFNPLQSASWLICAHACHLCE